MSRQVIIWMNETVCGNKEESNVARSVWGKDYRRFRSAIRPGDLVIPRYSTVPYTYDVFAEMRYLQADVITSRESVESIVAFEWYDRLVEGGVPTPRSWVSGKDNFLDIPEGRYVVKGKCNSRKFKWKTHMYAENLAAMRQVIRRLYDDDEIARQGLVVREFVDYRVVEEGCSVGSLSLPLIDEWRVFVLNGEYLIAGYYWLHQLEDCSVRRPDGGSYFSGEPPVGVKDLAVRCADVLDYEFFSVDVACTTEGEWQVIEVNDGCMSGLQGINPEQFYQRLRQRLT